MTGTEKLAIEVAAQALAIAFGGLDKGLEDWRWVAKAEKEQMDAEERRQLQGQSAQGA